MSSSYRFGNYILHPTKEWPWLGTLEWNQTIAAGPSGYPPSTGVKKVICDVCGKIKGSDGGKLSDVTAKNKKIPSFEGWSAVKTVESPVSATASPIPNGTNDLSVGSGDSQIDNAFLSNFANFADSSK